MTDTLSIPKRQQLITGLSCFTTLTADESEELALIMTEEIYQAGATIVKQDDLVDSIFIIITGQAEVIHEHKLKTKITHKIKIKKTPLAILNPGEAIGLNDSGFFSSTGLRTATVIALTEMRLLKLDIKNLHYFFTAHPRLRRDMYAAAEQMLRMQLIKQSLPFNKLSAERLQWLARHVKEITIPAGEIIFKQGEQGNECYLIRSGLVEILEMEGKEERHLATLKPPTLFGEATLITNSPRNATARAKEDCELLALRHEYLSELLESEDNVANMFMTLMVDRSRPLKNPHVVVHERVAADEQHIVILKNPHNGHYFKLSQEGVFIWQQLDGKHTMQEITLALADKFNMFAPDIVVALISKLAKAGFIYNVEVPVQEGSANQAGWAKAVWRMRRILEKRVAIGDADKWITTIYKKLGYVFFTSVGKILLSAVALLGVIAFGYSTPHIVDVFKTIPHSWVLLILLIPFTIISIAFHEMGHALATKAFGYEVHYMGVGWYWLRPVAFTDTSDMWLSTRWPRMVVNLAGIYTDILLAGISSILIFIIPSGYVQGFLWLFALYTYINAFRMLSPLQELDGYYALMDLLERPRLRQSAVMWLVKEFPKTIRHPKLARHAWPQICYWLACLVFLILLTLLVLFVQGFVFKIFGIHSSNIFLTLALPLTIVVLSSLTVLAEIRNKVE